MKGALKPAAPPGPGPFRVLVILSRVLLALILGLGICILAGTIYAVYRDRGVPAAGGAEPGDQGRARPGAAVQDRAAPGETAIFTGIGRLRIPVAAPGGSGTLVLSIAFPYSLRDRAFAEELASRVGDFRHIAAAYFSSLPAGDLRGPDEEKLKAELLRSYNGILRLGKIETIYFNDLLLFE
jgi:flagellar basal body-associated protein FliL